jgi:hypothetical protein
MAIDLYRSVETLKGPGLKSEAFAPPVRADGVSILAITPNEPSEGALKSTTGTASQTRTLDSTTAGSETRD